MGLTSGPGDRNAGPPRPGPGPAPGPGAAPEHRALRDAVRSLLARHQTAADSTADEEAPGGPGYDQTLWQRLCREIGVAGLAIPQCYGGSGAGPVETHIVAEELGRELTPSPLLGSAVLAAQAVLASGDAAACQRLLPPIADGTAIAALAWAGEAGHWDPGDAACAATQAPAGGWALTGTAHYVLDGDSADLLLVAAQTPAGTGLFEVDSGQPAVARTAAVTMDGSRRLSFVQLKGLRGSGSAGPLALRR